MTLGPPHRYISVLLPGLQVGHVIGVALVQVVGGVGGGGGGAAAQCPPPARAAVLARVCPGAKWDLGGLPGAARAPQGTLKYLRLEVRSGQVNIMGGSNLLISHWRWWRWWRGSWRGGLHWWLWGRVVRQYPGYPHTAGHILDTTHTQCYWLSRIKQNTIPRLSWSVCKNSLARQQDLSQPWTWSEWREQSEWSQSESRLSCWLWWSGRELTGTAPPLSHALSLSCRSPLSLRRHSPRRPRSPPRPPPWAPGSRWWWRSPSSTDWLH